MKHCMATKADQSSGRATRLGRRSRRWRSGRWRRRGRPGRPPGRGRGRSCGLRRPVPPRLASRSRRAGTAADDRRLQHPDRGPGLHSIRPVAAAVARPPAARRPTNAGGRREHASARARTPSARQIRRPSTPGAGGRRPWSVSPSSRDTAGRPTSHASHNASAGGREPDPHRQGRGCSRSRPAAGPSVALAHEQHDTGTVWAPSPCRAGRRSTAKPKKRVPSVSGSGPIAGATRLTAASAASETVRPTGDRLERARRVGLRRPQERRR